MLRKCSLAILFSIALAHNAFAVIDPILLMENAAQYLEQFKEGVNSLEAMWRRMEEFNVLLGDIEKIGDNLGSAAGDVMKVGKSLDPGKIGGSFMGKLDSLPVVPTQPYKPGQEKVVLDAAKKGFAGKSKIQEWVKKEIFSSDRKDDPNEPTDEEIMEEKRILVNSMRNATGIDSYAYGVMVETRLESMPAEEESKAMKLVSDAKTEGEKLKALEALQGRIADRLNEINKLQAKLTEITSINAMQPDPLEEAKKTGEKEE